MEYTVEKVTTQEVTAIFSDEDIEAIYEFIGCTSIIDRTKIMSWNGRDKEVAHDHSVLLSRLYKQLDAMKAEVNRG